MKKIGITGGIGAGKTIVLNELTKLCHCRILEADRVAWQLEEKGQPCYKPLIDLLGKGILASDGSIDRKKMADLIFPDQNLVNAVNAIVHPAVCAFAKEEAKKAAKDGYDYFFLEAALLIEGKCDAIMDEVWYVYAPRYERIRRLANDRGYSREKILSIMKRQLTEREFRRHADRVINNTGDPEQIGRQLQRWLT